MVIKELDVLGHWTRISAVFQKRINQLNWFSPPDTNSKELKVPLKLHGQSCRKGVWFFRSWKLKI